MGNFISNIFLIVFTLFWSGMVLMFDGFEVRGIYKQFESKSYPAVTGIITHSEVKRGHSSNDGNSYDADVEYRFEVDGHNYSGKKFRLGVTTSGSFSANAMVSSHPVGSSVQVFYNSQNPEESLLSPGVTGSDFMLILFMTPFHAVMIGLWVWVGGNLREWLSKPVAGGVRIITNGLTTRIRLPRFPAIMWGLITAGSLGFISIFIIGFSTDMNPSLWLVSSTIVIVYVAGIGVYVWQRQKINSGIDDLILNQSSQSLELPLTFGRKQRVTVPVTDIESLIVEKIEHRSSKGGISYTYAPVIRLRRTEPAIQKLADWSSRSKANDFTGWLHQQLGGNIPSVFEQPVSAAVNFGAAFPPATTEIRRDEHSRIQVTDGPGGREFYFPAARNIGTVIGFTGFVLAWTGFTVAAYLLFKSLFFEIAFTFVDVLILFACLNLWLKSSRVTINSSGVTTVNRWLFFGRTRWFAVDEIARFDTKMGMQSGKKIFQSIVLVTRAGEENMATRQAQFQPAGVSSSLKSRVSNPRGRTIASGIASAPEANWLVQEMTRALRRNV